MGQFTYIAIDAHQHKVSGSVKASDRGEALRLIEKKGLRPTKVTEDKSEPKESKKSTKEQKRKSAKPQPARVEKKSKRISKESNTGGSLKLKKKEVILFTEELADMLAAGLQLEPALQSMENRQQKGNLQKVSEQIRALVRDGTSFSRALQMTSPSFSPLYVNMAAAGEASGALDTILTRQAHYLKTIGELQNKVILALIYPAFLVVAGLAVSIIFVTTLIPQLATLLETIPNAEMPSGAAAMLTVTSFLRKWWWIFLVLLIIAFIAFKSWKDVEANRPAWDKIKLGFPLVGAVNKDRFYVQFLETMSNLVGNGMTLLRALDLTKNATQNLHFKEHLSGIIERVGDGRSLSSSLKASEAFPDLLIDMVIVGEQTGKIDVALGKAAERYDKELNNSLQRVMALMMPAVLMVISVLVGMMVYLLLTAIFQTINQIG